MAITTSTLKGASKAILKSFGQITTAQMNTENLSRIGFTRSLMSQQNMQYFNDMAFQTIENESGKSRKLSVTFRQRALESDVATTENCDPATERQPIEKDVTISLAAYHTITVSEEEIIRLDNALQSPDQQLAGRTVYRPMGEYLSLDLDPMRRKINSLLLGVYNTAYGKYVGQTLVPPATQGSKDFNVIKTADNAVVWKGMNDWQYEAMLTGMSGRPIAFGAGNLWRATNTIDQSVAGLNDQGLDTGALRTNRSYEFYTDLAAGGVLGDANAFGWYMPGLAKILSWNKFRAGGKFFGEWGLEYRFTIPDPIFPDIVYDAILTPVGCPDYTLTLKLAAHFDLWYPTLDMFKTGDPLEGVNGLFKGVATGS